MKDSIYKKQNDDFLLLCLMAQRSEYSNAKSIVFRKSLATVGCCIASVVGAVYGKELLTAFISLVNVVVFVLNKHSDQKINALKLHATSIQQYVDVTLFSSVIGNQPYVWGDVPTKTELAESVSQVQGKDSSAVWNWYNDYSSLPGPLQVFYCQRENVRWNFRLYNSFLKLINGISVVVVFLLLTVMFARNISLIRFVIILSWAIPIFESFWSTCKEIENSMNQMKRLDSFCKQLEVAIEKDNSFPTEKDLIDLQSMIRKRRETCYLIPDWFYNLTKDKYQSQEDSIADKISQK